MALKKVGVSLEADGSARFNSAIRDAGKAVTDFGSTAQKAAGGFDVFGKIATGALLKVGALGVEAFVQAGRAMAGFVGESVNAAATFESSLNRFGSVAGDAVAAAGMEIADFSDLALEMGAKTQYSAGQAADAMVELAKGGLDPATIAAGGLEGALSLAAAGELDLSEAANITAKQLGVWSDQGVTAAQIADRLAQAANASTVDVDELAMGMANVGGVAKIAGVTFDETTQTLALLAPGFSSAADASTSMKTFLSRLIPTTKDATKAMIALGLANEDGSSKFYDSTGAFIGMKEAAQLLQDQTKDLSQEQRLQAFQTIFGSDAIPAAAMVAEAGGAGFEAMGTAMEGAGTASEQAAKRNQGFAFAMESLRGSIETVQIVLGTALLPVLTGFIQNALIPGVNAALTFAQAILASSDPMGMLVAQIGTVIPGFTTLVNWLQVAIPTAVTAAANVWSTMLFPALQAVGGFIAMTVLPAIGTLIGWLQTNIPMAVTTAANIWTTILQPALATAGSFIVTTVIPAFQQIAHWIGQNIGLLQTIGAAIGVAVGVFATISTIVGIVSSVALAFSGMATAVTTAGGVLAIIVAALGGPVTIAIGAVALAVGALYLAWQTNFGGIQDKTAAVWDYLSGTVWPWLTDAFNTVSTAVLPVLQSAFETTWSAVSTAVSTVYDYLSGTVWPWLQGTAFPWLTDTALPALSGAWSATFGAFKPIIDEFWPYLRDNVWPELKSIWDNTINKELPALKAAWDEVFGAFKPIIDEFWPYLRDQVWPELQAIWNNTINKELPALQAAWDSTFGEVTRAIETAREKIVTAWEIVTTAAETAKTLVSTAWTELKTAVETKIGEVVTLAQGLPAQITGAIGNLGSLLLQSGKDLIGGSLDGINAAWEGVKTRLGELTRLIPQFKGPPARDAKLLFESGRLIIEGLIQGFGSMKPALVKELTNITDLIGKVFSVVSSGTGTLTALAGYKPGLLRDTVVLFANDLFGVVSTLEAVVQKFSKDGIKAAGLWAESASKVVSVIGSGVDALTKLKDYSAGLTRDTVLNFGHDLYGVVSTLQVIVRDFDQEAVTAAAAWSESAGKVVGIIGSAVDNLTKLGDYKAGQITQLGLSRFAYDLYQSVKVLAGIAAMFKEEAMEAAAVFAVRAEKVVGLLSTAVSAFEGLRDYEDVATSRMEMLAADIDDAVWLMTDMARTADTEGATAAGAFAASVGDVFTLFKTCAESLDALRDYESVPQERMTAVVSDFEAAIRLMTQVADRANLEGVARAAEYSTASQTVFGYFKSGAEAIDALRDYESVPADRMRAILGDFEGAIWLMTQVADRANLDGVTKAAAFSEASTNIFGAITAGTDAFAALREYESVPPDRMQALLTDIGTAVGLMQGSVTQAVAMETQAGLWRSALETFAADVRAGIDAVASVDGLLVNASASVSASVGDTNNPEHRARGGSVTAGAAYIVGERGRELFVPDVSGVIIPNNRISPPASPAQQAQQVMIQNMTTINNNWSPTYNNANRSPDQDFFIQRALGQ